MKIGFIGCGNMGSSILKGIIKSGKIDEENVFVSDTSEKCISSLEGYNVNITDNCSVAENSDIIFLCVKPNIILSVSEEIKPFCNSKIIVSIAAGICIEKYEKIFGNEASIVRVMPNTPALVGEGMFGICSNTSGEKSAETVKSLLESLGMAQIVPETLMDTVTAVSGSSPAMIFMLIEAMADSAVQGGMSRCDAYMFASQCVLGSAKMVLETGKHPGELKDMVCSPKGTTIDMVASLEKNGFRNGIIEALKVCREKSESMK